MVTSSPILTSSTGLAFRNKTHYYDAFSLAIAYAKAGGWSDKRNVGAFNNFSTSRKKSLMTDRDSEIYMKLKNAAQEAIREEATFFSVGSLVRGFCHVRRTNNCNYEDRITWKVKN